jgi:Flp pilus assembly protein TadB
VSALAVSTVLFGAAGIGALAAWLLLVLGDLFARARRLYRPRWRDALQTFFATEQDREDADRASPAGKAQEALIYLPGVAALLLAIPIRDVLLSPYLVLLGAGLTWFLGARHTRQTQAAISTQIRSLVVLFRSRYAVGASPFAVLAEIQDDLPPGPVAAAVRRAVNAYGSTGSVATALAPLRDLHNPYLARLAMVLETSGAASTQAIVDEVERIEDDLKERDRLAGQARASLALLKGTVRFLQAANLAAIVAAVVLPLWRDFFTSTLQRRGTFLAATLFLTLASLYFDQEIALQEEKAL